MGYFKIEVLAVGGHGDAREVGDGQSLNPETYADHSVDKVAFDVVDQLKAKGAVVEEATLTHWPNTPTEVVDNLLTKTRKGSF